MDTKYDMRESATLLNFTAIRENVKLNANLATMGLDKVLGKHGGQKKLNY